MQVSFRIGVLRTWSSGPEQPGGCVHLATKAGNMQGLTRYTAHFIRYPFLS